MQRVGDEMPPVLWRKVREPGLAAALRSQLVLFRRHSEEVEMVVMHSTEIYRQAPVKVCQPGAWAQNTFV